MKSMLFVFALGLLLSLVSCGGINKSTKSSIRRNADSFHQKAERKWSQMSFIDVEEEYSWIEVKCIA